MVGEVAFIDSHYNLLIALWNIQISIHWFRALPTGLDWLCRVMGATFNPRKKTMSVSCKKSDHGPGIVWPRGHVTYVMMSALANEKPERKKCANEKREIFQFIWQQAAI